MTIISADNSANSYLLSKGKIMDVLYFLYFPVHPAQIAAGVLVSVIGGGLFCFLANTRTPLERVQTIWINHQTMAMPLFDAFEKLGNLNSGLVVKQRTSNVRVQ